MFSAVISSRPTLWHFMKNSDGLSGSRIEMWPRVKSSWPSLTSTLPAQIIFSLISAWVI